MVPCRETRAPRSPGWRSWRRSNVMAECGDGPSSGFMITAILEVNGLLGEGPASSTGSRSLSCKWPGNIFRYVCVQLGHGEGDPSPFRDTMTLFGKTYLYCRGPAR